MYIGCILFIYFKVVAVVKQSWQKQNQDKWLQANSSCKSSKSKSTQNEGKVTGNGCGTAWCTNTIGQNHKPGEH